MKKRINMVFPELPYAVEEALNRLRVNVCFSGREVKRILVVSSVPDEGKSRVSQFLWKMLAESGFRTVLLDADLRKSVMKEELKFKFDGELKGMSYYLSGQAEYEDIIYDTNVENAYIVPCAKTLQNPSSLLQDDRLDLILKRLGEEFDYVIVDSAPLVAVSDGIRIASLCDGALLVIRSGMVPKALIRQSLNDLKRSGCNLLGTVLNGIHTDGVGKYGKYGRYGYYSKYYNKYYSKYYASPDAESVPPKTKK